MIEKCLKRPLLESRHTSPIGQILVICIQATVMAAVVQLPITRVQVQQSKFKGQK